MIVVSGHFRIPVERMTEARPLMQQIVAETLCEPGCLGYSYAEDLCEPGLIRVSEAWDSTDALTAHLATTHMQRWRTEREALGLSDRDITRYDIAGAEKF